MGHSARQKTSRTVFAAIVAAGMGFAPVAPQAATKIDEDPLIEGAKLCTRYLPRHERQYGIPEHLLAAIASTESGRFHRALGLNLPWPWTINVEGAGHFYETKEQAIEAVRSYQARGFASIDVGCMQVNLQHHPNAFASLEQAFDPAYNVAYAAHFLKENFEEEKSWRRATADYHSRTQLYGDQYARLVYGAWSRIINKVADARAGKPILNASVRPSPIRVRAFQPMHLHDISVARDTTREKGVIIVRPDYNPQPEASTQRISWDNDFVIHPIRKDQQSSPAVGLERSAIAPNGVAVASTADEVSHGAQIVKVRADGTVSPKGQFDPAGHVIHAGTEPSVAGPGDAATSSGGPAAGAPNSPFIFQ
jgi:hypothetical protein